MFRRFPFGLAAGLAFAGLAAGLASCQETEEDTSQLPTGSPASASTAAVSSVPAATLAPSASPGKAPDGCISGELVYEDPAGRFAFCYPADMELVTADFQGEGPAPAVRYWNRQTDYDPNYVSIDFDWNAQGRVGLVSNAPCLPDPLVIKNERIEPFEVGGRTGVACFQDLYDQTDGEILRFKAIHFEAPLAAGGAIEVDVVYAPNGAHAGASVEDLANRVLDSAVISE